MKELAIDLLWLRPGKVGGTEFYIRNLLDGLLESDDEFHLILVAAKDNADTLRHYEKDARFRILCVNIEAERIGKRLIWQNLFENHLLRRNEIRACFSPVLFRPMWNGGVRWMNTIHDIQAYHYPEYHPFYETLYSKLCWRAIRRHSERTIAISEYVKTDLVHELRFSPEQIQVIYNPVCVREPKEETFETMKSRYGIEKGEYYYTLSQLIPHKNLNTLIHVMEKLRDNEHSVSSGEPGNFPTDKPHKARKLLISGVSGFQSEKLKDSIREKNLEDLVILTGFVENEEKFSLLRNCRTFLFPSVFEGFGIPPIEAMMMNVPVITTRCTSIPEVTQNRAYYVEDPFSAEEWIALMNQDLGGDSGLDPSVYDKKRISRQYLQTLLDFAGNDPEQAASCSGGE